MKENWLVLLEDTDVNQVECGTKQSETASPPLAHPETQRIAKANAKTGSVYFQRTEPSASRDIYPVFET